MENRTTFFRQSSWLILANTAGGLFMAAVHVFAASMPPDEYGVFFTLLRVFLLLSIPAAGLQIVFAQQAAGAISEERRRELAGTVRGVLWGTFVFWLVLVGALALFEKRIAGALNVTNPAALWLTACIALAALWLPLLQGLLQGLQNFLWLGWSFIFNGAGRLIAIAIIVVVFHGWAAGALAGALLGMMGALLMSLWAGRAVFKVPPARFAWRPWLKRVLPLSGGVGSILFVMNADMVAVQSFFPPEATPFYAASAMIGVALVLFTTPLAAVMFPKIVQSVARAEKTDALTLALAGTALLGGAAALFCTLFPELPLRLLYARNPVYLQSAVLVPWFLWCLLPVTLANVLVGNLMARGRFGAVPWLVLVAAGYGISLLLIARAVQEWEPFAAFRMVILNLGCFSLILLAVAAWFTWRPAALRGLKPD